MTQISQTLFTPGEGSITIEGTAAFRGQYRNRKKLIVISLYIEKNFKRAEKALYNVGTFVNGIQGHKVERESK